MATVGGSGPERTHLLPGGEQAASAFVELCEFVEGRGDGTATNDRS